LFKEAPKKWAEYRSFARRLQGSITITTESIKPRRPAGKPARWQFKQNDNCALVSFKDAIQTPRPGQATREVYAINPNYGFQLKGTEASKEWVITGIERENKDNIQWVGMPVGEIVARTCSLPFAVHARHLDLLLPLADFKVNRVLAVNRNGRDLVQFDFELPPQRDDKQYFPFRSGSVFLDPDHYWCVQEYEGRGIFGNGWGTVREIREFKDVHGYPVLTRIIETQKGDPNQGANDPGEYKETQDFDFDEPAGLPGDQEFTLSAFGLPEPIGVNKAKPRWYVWVGGASIACLIAGAVIWRFGKRSA
jgi:hypothetical protein